MNPVPTPKAFPLAAAALLLAAGPALAAGGYALAGLRATNGYPVAGIPDGVILARGAGPACSAVAAGPGAGDPGPGAPGDGIALAGPAGGAMTLRATVVSCPPGVAPPVLPAPPPQFHCAWSLGPGDAPDEGCRKGTAPPPPPGEGYWNGLEGELTLPLPAETGIYRLALSCQAADGGSLGSVERTLFVTLAEPRPQVSPPQPDWYRRAACWGGGFAAGADEDAALRALTAGAFHFGSRHWRYGSFDDTKDSPDRCATEPFAAVCSEGWCHCCWQALVAGDASCNYGSCYEFSQVLDAIAATLGIGGLIPVSVSGAAGAGFATPPEVRSLDPNFPANTTCDLPPAQCPLYVFSSHSLRQRDGLYFDATFDKVYRNENGPVYRSLEDGPLIAGKYYPFLNGRNIACQLYEGYGNWIYYSYPRMTAAAAARPAVLCPSDPTKPATFTGEVSATPYDPDDDGVAQALALDLGVKILEEGSFVVNASLLAEGRPVTRRLSNRRQLFSNAVVSGAAGDNRAHIYFSGADLAELGGARQLHLQATLFSHRGLVASFEADLPRMDLSRFGEKVVEIRRAETTGGEETSGGGPGDLLVGLRAARTMTVTIDARLAAGGRTLAYFGQTVPVVKRGERGVDAASLLEEEQSVRLPLPPALADLDGGPLELTLVVYDAAGRALDSRVVKVGSGAATEPSTDGAAAPP